MAVTFIDPVPVGPNSWLLAWSSDQSDPTYRVYQDGRYLYSTRVNAARFTLEGDASSVIEVLDDPAAVPSAVFPASTELVWSSVNGAGAYRVEQKVDSVWTLAGEIEDAGKTSQRYETPVLPDGATGHDFRVTSIGVDKNEAAPTNVQVRMVRHPSPPKVAYTYDAGTGDVTIANAVAA